MEQNFIKDTWRDIESSDNWIDYILPKRSTDDFWDEGQAQAYEIAKHYDINNDIILDFGCGIGRIIKFLKAKEKHGADASAKFLKNIDDKTVETHYSDGLNLIKDYDYFDFIFSIMVFQHNDKKFHPTILKNLYKILKPSGKIYIQFPKKPNEYYVETPFVNLYEKEELINLFSGANFKDIQVDEGNLVGYGANGEYEPIGNLEYFITAYK